MNGDDSVRGSVVTRMMRARSSSLVVALRSAVSVYHDGMMCKPLVMCSMGE